MRTLQRLYCYFTLNTHAHSPIRPFFVGTIGIVPNTLHTNTIVCVLLPHITTVVAYIITISK